MNSNPLKVVVLISGSGSNLQAFIDQAKDINIEIQAVLSNKAEAFGLERARKANIPAIALPHSDFDSREDFDQALIKELDQYNPELIILAGFMRILSPSFVNHFKDKIINIHPSLLPKYKGLNTHQRAIDAGEKNHGASVHLVTAELDDGPVIIQGQLAILPVDTADSLQKRIHKIEHKIYPQAVQWIAFGDIILQNEKVNHSKTLEKMVIF